MITTTYHSPLGDITLAADARGLTGLWFADQAHYGSTLEGDEPSFDMERGVFEDAVNAACMPSACRGRTCRHVRED